MTNNQYEINNINYQLHRLLKNKKLIQSEIIVNNLLKSLDDKNPKQISSTLTLILKFYIEIENVNQLDNIILKYMKYLDRKDLLEYVNFLYKIDKEKSIFVFNKLLLEHRHNISSKNLEFLVENKLNDIIKLLDGKYIKVKFENNVSDFSNLRFYDFNSTIIDDTLNQIRNQIKNFQRLINFIELHISSFEKNKNKQMLIDGGNVLFYTKNIENGYKNLILVINYYIKLGIQPILIIHPRHLKTSSKGKQKSSKIVNYINTIKNNEKLLMYQTDYNVYDDFYIIYFALYFKIKILTNDKCRDHIFKLKTHKYNSEDYVNFIDNYLNDLIVNYNIFNETLTINDVDSLNISKCIQVVNDKIYCPTTNNGYFIL